MSAKAASRLAFEMKISGHKALLTGATGGLGRAVAATLAERGASLVLSGRDANALEALAAELPGEHATLAADLAEPGAAEELAARAGEVDILLANAGLPGTGWLPDFPVEDIVRALRVNLEAPILLARALYPAMVARGEGSLVFVSSLSGKAASPRSSIYNATKFGLRGFALGLRTDLAPHDIGVSLVSPGFIRDAGMFADTGAATPPGIGTATPAAVAAAVVKAIESNRTEIAVAPPLSRALAHFGLASPALSARIQSAPIGQKAAKEVAAGHQKTGKR
jgi:short-subunit dehydrogenase